ncbi:MAG TPA: DUF4388 domain-containing protein [Caldithrix abyssi]|uniref:DUF4388 domain-containing protein n=1 Tax=Caldithrix abyssi TaxID=187145 RepID=A0A7V5VEX4_CALAY|nr:DUF4388 domain-containing protein [Caldithrix abyssi]
MREVFVISEKESIYRMFVVELSGLPIHLTWVGDMEKAQGAFDREKPDFIFFAVRDNNLLHNWLARFKRLQLKVPFICFLGHSDWEKRELLWMAGASEVIGLPMLRKEFRIIIENLMKPSGKNEKIDKDIEGDLSQYSLMDLIQSLEDSRQNGILKLYAGERAGEIVLDRGAIVNARFDKQEPVMALRMMAQWNNGRFHFIPDKIHHKEEIKLDNQQILKECQLHHRLYEKAVDNIPDRDIVFYTSPLLDFEQIGPMARKYLLYFKNGLTPADFLEQHGTGSLKIPENLLTWINKKWLVKRSVYNQQLAQVEKQQKTSGVKRIFDKVFARGKAAPRIDYSSTHASSGASLEEILTRRPYLFTDHKRLKALIDALDKHYA